jgi:glucoside 3-dehydrogenase (cytochrome c) hitch-hiker subunit
MNRRDLIKSAILASTGSALSGQTHTHTAPASAAAAAAEAGKGEALTPLVFDSHQNETVVALSELIIPTTDTPGAKAAKVNEYIDLMLHDVAEDKGHSFLMGLGWLDGYAIRKNNAPFLDCSEAQQIEILKSLDGATDADLKPGAEFFKQVKRYTVDGYYTSKIGIEELNKGGRVPATFACEHDSHA